uniref:Uncharacterized protein n=1 Tax=Arundo donax TaxID=35708 RepID=A0A0A9C2Z4_ARUDO
MKCICFQVFRIYSMLMEESNLEWEWVNLRVTVFTMYWVDS